MALMKYRYLNLILGSLLAIALVPLSIPMSSKVLQKWLEVSNSNANFLKMYQAELMAEVAGGYGGIGETDQAVQILDKALALAESLPEKPFKNLPLKEICHQYVTIDYLDKAIESANAMPQDTLKVYCLMAITAQYRIQGSKTIPAKLIDQALQTVDAMPIKDEEATRGLESKSLGLLSVIEELIASRQFDQASQVARTIPLSSYQQEAYTKILKAKEKKVQTLKPKQKKAKKVCTGIVASEILKCAIQKVESVRQPESLAKDVEERATMGIFKPFLEDLTRDEKPAETQEILAQVLQVIQSTSYESVKPEAMAQIATEYARVGQKEKAMEILADALSIAKNYGQPKCLVWFYPIGCRNAVR